MLIVVVFLWLIMATLAAAIAANKGQNWLAFFLYGMLIWPVALIHALMMRPDPKYVEQRAMATGVEVKCPHCAELIKREAKVCKHCGRDIAPAGSAPAGPGAAA